MLNLTKASLDWALEHALSFGDTDVFPRPFEFEAVRHDWANVSAHLLSADVLAWNVRQHRTLLAAKGRVGFRPVTQLDPLDFLVFAALIREIGQEVEDRRIPTTSEIVFSYRFSPLQQGRLFDPKIGYTSFVERAASILAAKKAPSYVVVTDIADFYPRIYHHRLENALQAATTKTNHVKALMALLAGWNGTESYGIPVGSAPARLLAEAALMDIDEALLAYGVAFIRFNDDYRLFAKSFAEAYRHLALLAELLHRNHGLTLQREKTAVLKRKDFSARFLDTPARKEKAALRDKFGSLVKALGLSNPYETIDYDELDAGQRAIVDSLNLKQLLEEELDSKDPDFAIVRFAIRRFAQLQDDSAIDLLLDQIDDSHPAFPDLIRYLLSLDGLGKTTRHKLGGRVLDLLEDSVVSELAWHRMWALTLFSKGTEWNHTDRFVGLVANTNDLFLRRELVLALGRAGQRHWFQTHWRHLFDESPWPRRALLAAASCMAPDARKHWYKSLMPRLDVLETAVVRWAKQNPFS